jgi:hypothetical protein
MTGDINLTDNNLYTTGRVQANLLRTDKQIDFSGSPDSLITTEFNNEFDFFYNDAKANIGNINHLSANSINSETNISSKEGIFERTGTTDYRKNLDLTSYSVADASFVASGNSAWAAMALVAGGSNTLFLSPNKFQIRRTTKQHIITGHNGTSDNYWTGSSILSQIDTSGNWLPGSTNTYNLGSSSYRWKNIYSVSSYPTYSYPMYSNPSSEDVDKDMSVGGDLLVTGKLTAGSIDPRDLSFDWAKRQDILDDYEKWTPAGKKMSVFYINEDTGVLERYDVHTGTIKDALTGKVLSQFAPRVNNNIKTVYYLDNLEGKVKSKEIAEYNKIKLHKDFVVDKQTGDLIQKVNKFELKKI